MRYFTLFLVALMTASTAWSTESTEVPAETPKVAEENLEENIKMTPENPKVSLETSLGRILVELYPNKAPESVKNFLQYVDEEFYTGTIFHRVIKGFMIQGGGFTPDMKQKPTRSAIQNEAANGLKNERGTLAMARTMVVDSATSQFFINLVDNAFLDHRDETPKGFGYAVFGRVVEGMDVVDKIAGVKTGQFKRFRDVPLEPVAIERATRAGS